jgi:hypothetical protein
MKPVYANLRGRGFLSASFIDDCYLREQSYEECIGNINATIHLFQSLGFVVHEEKSVLTPCHRIKYLGFWLNSENMTVTLPDEKMTHIENACKTLLLKSRMTIRELAQVIGTHVAAFPAVWKE